MYIYQNTGYHIHVYCDLILNTISKNSHKQTNALLGHNYMFVNMTNTMALN